MDYSNVLQPLEQAPPLLADFPQYVEPLSPDRRLFAPPLVHEPDGRLLVRAWRYWYNVRGIVETENRLDARATALIVVHPWGVDDGHGLRTPQPAGIAFFCSAEKNAIGLAHMREVVNPFLRRWRGHVAVIGYSLPGSEDELRRRLYASANTAPEALDRDDGERRLRDMVSRHAFRGEPLIQNLQLDPRHPVKSYFEQTPSTDAGPRYNGQGFWELPMPLAAPIEYAPTDVMFYDAEGYPKVRDWLQGKGVRHVLLAGYATDMCVAATTCGYRNLCQDFNVFLVGDATLATFPGSTTPRFATQVALANAALTQLITQVSWVKHE